MEIRNLQSFLRIAETGNFTVAAASLGYAQSTITAQIQQLESEIGVPLFERIGRRIQLTQAGSELIGYASRIVELSGQALTIGGGDPRYLEGTLRIGAVESIINSTLLAVISDFRLAFPRIKVSIISSITSKLYDMLRSGEIDIALTMGQMTDVKDGKRVHSSKERALFFAADSHPLARKRQISFEQLLEYEIIDMGNHTFLQQEVYRLASEAGLTISSSLQTENSGVLINLVRQGLGVSYLPEYILKNPLYKNQGIKILPVKDFDLPFYTHIFYHKNKWVTPQMQAMTELLSES